MTQGPDQICCDPHDTNPHQLFKDQEPAADATDDQKTMVEAPPAPTAPDAPTTPPVRLEAAIGPEPVVKVRLSTSSPSYSSSLNPALIQNPIAASMASPSSNDPTNSEPSFETGTPSSNLAMIKEFKSKFDFKQHQIPKKN